MSQWVSDKGEQWSDSGPIKITIYFYQWRRSDFVISWSGSLGSARPLCKYIPIYPRWATAEVTRFHKYIRCVNIFSYIHDLIMIIVTPGHQVVLFPCSRVPKSLGIFLHLEFNKDRNNAINQPIVHHIDVRLDKLHVCWLRGLEKLWWFTKLDERKNVMVL